jgi:hypothetical protein
MGVPGEPAQCGRLMTSAVPERRTPTNLYQLKPSAVKKEIETQERKNTSLELLANNF